MYCWFNKFTKENETMTMNILIVSRIKYNETAKWLEENTSLKGRAQPAPRFAWVDQCPYCVKIVDRTKEFFWDRENVVNPVTFVNLSDTVKRELKEKYPKSLKEPEAVTLKDVIERLNVEGPYSHKAAFVEGGKVIAVIDNKTAHTVRDVVVIKGMWYEVTKSITTYEANDDEYEIYEVKKTTEGFSD
jgi:hypothetical protein